MPTTSSPDEIAAERLAPVVAGVADVRRQIAALQAHEARLLAQAAQIADEWRTSAKTQSDAELAQRAVAAELAVALRVSDRTVQRQMADAERIVNGFSETLASLASGRISLAHARVIVEAGERIERPELRADYEANVLPYAEAESASRLRPVAKRRAQWYLDETIRQRHAAAAATRAVQVHDLDDGMASLHLTGPAVIVHAIHDRVTRMAREVSDAEAHAIRDARTAAREADGEAAEQARTHLDNLVEARRSIDAIRVDLIADLLLASDPVAHVDTTATGLGNIRATVQVTVPVLTLIDSPVDDPFDAVTLAGHGPIDPETARQLALHAPGWDRILTHPISGAVLAVDRYQPSTQMRRSLAIRDQHCRFPGCRQSTARSDIDHTVDWDHGGATATTNLAHLCRRHHTLKHHTPWTVRQQPGGVLEWTSPTGKHYPDHPASGVHFATDAEFDPAPF